MDNISEQINNYLQHKMSVNEQAAFEKQLITDTALQEAVQVQKKIIAAAENAGLKLEFAKAIRHRIFIKRLIITGTVIIISLITVLILNTREKEQPSANSLDTTGTADSTAPFIHPPMPSINVPLSEYRISAESGDTIFHPSGSILCFPPNAFTDEAGNIITGTVTIQYREFADPVDFFVSGIPMQYDSAGRKYNFESSGMCEINAYQDSKVVFVNKKARPQLNLSSKNNSPLHNVYFLDTIAKAWKYTGKDIITEWKKTADENAGPADYAVPEKMETILAKPLKPVLASDDRQKFSLKIDPGSFEELYTYDNLRFEVVDENTNKHAVGIVEDSKYKPSDANEHWDNVQLERTNTEGIYNITFINASRKVTYKVRPVLSGADYTAALKSFNEKNRQYEAIMKSRIVNDQKATDSINWINKQIVDKVNADNAVSKLLVERQIQLRQQYKMGEVIRTFAIDNFGIWNCDHPQYPSNEVPIVVNYTDSSNNAINLFSVAVVYKGFNGICQFPSAKEIRVMPGSENMLWSIQGDYFYFFTYNDFAAAGITKNSGTFTFRMRRAAKKITSYSEIKELMANL